MVRKGTHPRSSTPTRSLTLGPGAHIAIQTQPGWKPYRSVSLGPLRKTIPSASAPRHTLTRHHQSRMTSRHLETIYASPRGEGTHWPKDLTCALTLRGGYPSAP